MKRILLNLFILFPFFLNAQCIVEAGDDQNICDYPEPFPKLNGQVIQADSIVSVKWVALTQDEDVLFFASNMLSDTTILNPEFHSHYERSVQFFLTVMDTDGDVCTDSVTYNFSDWVFLTIDKATIKDPSDTIRLWPAGGSNFPVVKYEWSPDYNISDVNDPTPNVWNDTTTVYRLFMTDSIGCTAEDDPFEVYIRSTADRSIDVMAEPAFYPNPAQSGITIPDVTRWKTILISDLKGNVIRSVSARTNIQVGDLPKGVYSLTFIQKNGSRITQKLVKQ